MGASSLLVEVDDAVSATALWAEALRRQVVAVDIVPAARSVMFVDAADVRELAEQIPSWSLRSDSDRSRQEVEVPTVYDGPDLDAVAQAWDMTTAEVVRTHTSHEMVVAFCGFAPGFAYCTGLPPRLSLPRLATPRPKVRAGSVGLAGEFTGVYPTASPGGWQLIGHTELTLWDETREHPAVLSPGTVVRFVEAS